MKTISLQVILMFFIMGTGFSQVENFEDETHEATSFTVDGINFTTTGHLFVEVRVGLGCDQSDTYLGSGFNNGPSGGPSFGSIKVTHPEDKFIVSTSSSWCVLLSSDGVHGTDGDVKFTGTLSNGETIEETFSIIHTQGSADDFVFSYAIWNDQELIELEASMVSSFNFILLDNLVFENLITTDVSSIEEKAIKIYPNPAMEEIEIIGVDAQEVKIMDAFGRMVKPSLSQQKIDISDLLAGIYYISIYTDNQQLTKRIIKY